MNDKKNERTTSGLAQAGVWLARKFVRIFNICARANGSETPAFAKPPPRVYASGRHSAVDKDEVNRKESVTRKCSKNENCIEIIENEINR
jgi:hypothetical protein